MDYNLLDINLGSNIYLIDFLDIFIIAVFSYIAILFLKQTRSLLAFAGMGVLGLIYILARAFHLYITALILQSFFSIFVIILVIVFQDELKRSFELLAASGTKRMIKKSVLSYSSTIFAIVQATSNLMRKKHGALIVIHGQDAIERHFRGGNALDGITTTTLLESIFDPKSPGHDGAVIIDKERISKFGVHLPLSENLRETKEKGTRHSAAVGTSEKGDSLVVVVSEERGEISIAKNGKLKTVKDTQELERLLLQHYKEKFPQKPHGFFQNLFRERLIEKISAILIACLAWFFVVYQAEIVQRDFNIPISFTGMSEEKIIKNIMPETVTVALSARGQTVLGGINPNSLRVAISGENISTGINEIELERANVNHPFNVSVVNISPSIIVVEAQKYNTHTVSVEANIKKESEDIDIKEISINPNKIKILVPENEEIPDFVSTEEIFITKETLEEEETIETRIALNNLYKIHRDYSSIVYITVIREQLEE